MSNGRRAYRDGIASRDTTTAAGDTGGSGAGGNSGFDDTGDGSRADSSGPGDEVRATQYDGDELPIDSTGSTGVRKKRGTSARRTKQSTGNGGDGDAGADSGTETAKERKRTASETTPRHIAFDSLGGSKQSKTAAQQKFNQAFIAEGFGLVFYGLSKLFRDDAWELPEDDALEIADRFSMWLKSGGSKRVATFERLVSKHGPAISLGIGLVTIVGPRVAHTRQKRVAQAIQKKAATGTGTATAPVASTAQDIPVVVPENGSNGTGARNSGGPPTPSTPVARSFRREDIAEFLGDDHA